MTDERYRPPTGPQPRTGGRYVPGADRPVPPGAPAPATDPALDALERYAAETQVTPRPDLAARISARVAAEPRQTAPRRFLGALRALDAGAAGRWFVRTGDTAFGRGTVPALLRVQALGVVLLTILTVGAVGAAGALAAGVVLRGITPPPPPDVERLVSPPPSLRLPLVSPSPSPSVDRSPSPIPSLWPSPVVDASPSPSFETEPAETEPVEGPPETRDGSGPGRTETPEPDEASTPRPTRTAEPDETRRPRPTGTPRQTDDD